MSALTPRPDGVARGEPTESIIYRGVEGPVDGSQRGLGQPDGVLEGQDGILDGISSGVNGRAQGIA